MRKAVPVLALLLTLTLAVSAQQQAANSSASSAPAKPVFSIAERLPTDAIPNFGKVSPFLYRGGQPRENGIAELHKLGVRVIVNLRELDQSDRDEQKQAEALGMRYVAIPWRGFDKPDDKQVAEFLQLIRANPETPVFVHCRRGAERTGVMVAAYRIAMQNWNAEQALQEMEAFKFRGLWFRHLKKYVQAFPEQHKTSALFQLQPAASNAAP